MVIKITFYIFQNRCFTYLCNHMIYFLFLKEENNIIHIRLKPGCLPIYIIHFAMKESIEIISADRISWNAFSHKNTSNNLTPKHSLTNTHSHTHTHTHTQTHIYAHTHEQTHIPNTPNVLENWHLLPKRISV